MNIFLRKTRQGLTIGAAVQIVDMQLYTHAHTLSQKGKVTEKNEDLKGKEIQAEQKLCYRDTCRIC